MAKKKQINTNTRERLRPKKRILNNKAIVIAKITAACILFFACCLFFFENINLFAEDVLNLRPVPIIFYILFFSGIFWICAHIMNLVSKIEDKNLYLADRFDWLYKAVFTLIILLIVVRSFVFIRPYLNVPEIILLPCIVSGLMTLLIPRIVDNNNEEF